MPGIKGGVSRIRMYQSMSPFPLVSTRVFINTNFNSFRLRPYTLRTPTDHRSNCNNDPEGEKVGGKRWGGNKGWRMYVIEDKAILLQQRFWE